MESKQLISCTWLATDNKHTLTPPACNIERLGIGLEMRLPSDCRSNDCITYDFSKNAQRENVIITGVGVFVGTPTIKLMIQWLYSSRRGRDHNISLKWFLLPSPWFGLTCILTCKNQGKGLWEDRIGLEWAIHWSNYTHHSQLLL